MASPWIDEHADGLAARAERDLEALVAISSPSGDAAAAEEVVAVATALAPAEAEVTRIPCSSNEHAADLVLRVTGGGTRRLLLVGHLDTVVAHDAHVPPQRVGPRMLGSGTIDMKAGVALSLGLLRALSGHPALGEASLLLVNDEEWRTEPFAHVARFAGVDAVLCFEAGEHDPDGQDAVVVRRKTAGSIRVHPHARAAHADVAQVVAACHDPQGPSRLTAVPTILSSGEALNVVPAHGELVCDVRADDLDALRGVLAAIPAEARGARIEAQMQREWPGMDAIAASAPVLAAAGEALGRSVVAAQRGGASDASHFAATVPVTIDGLGARGGHAHHPDEFVDLRSLQPRAEVALAVAHAVLMDT